MAGSIPFWRKEQETAFSSQGPELRERTRGVWVTLDRPRCTEGLTAVPQSLSCVLPQLLTQPLSPGEKYSHGVNGKYQPHPEKGMFMLDLDGWIEVCQVQKDKSTSRWEKRIPKVSRYAKRVRVSVCSFACPGCFSGIPQTG